MLQSRSNDTKRNEAALINILSVSLLMSLYGVKIICNALHMKAQLYIYIFLCLADSRCTSHCCARFNLKQ